jgi:hypothetical protein
MYLRPPQPSRIRALLTVAPNILPPQHTQRISTEQLRRKAMPKLQTPTIRHTVRHHLSRELLFLTFHFASLRELLPEQVQLPLSVPARDLLMRKRAVHHAV